MLMITTLENVVRRLHGAQALESAETTTRTSTSCRGGATRNDVLPAKTTPLVGLATCSMHAYLGLWTTLVQCRFEGVMESGVWSSRESVCVSSLERLRAMRCGKIQHICPALPSVTQGAVRATVRKHETQSFFIPATPSLVLWRHSGHNNKKARPCCCH